MEFNKILGEITEGKISEEAYKISEEEIEKIKEDSRKYRSQEFEKMVTKSLGSIIPEKIRQKLETTRDKYAKGKISEKAALLEIKSLKVPKK